MPLYFVSHVSSLVVLPPFYYLGPTPSSSVPQLSLSILIVYSLPSPLGPLCLALPHHFLKSL